MSQSGDLQCRTQASRSRLQDLGQLKAGGEIEARLVEQLVALFFVPACREGFTTRGVCFAKGPFQVFDKEASLPARSSLVGDLAVFGPAANRIGADPEEITCLLHPHPVRTYGLGTHEQFYRTAAANS